MSGYVISLDPSELANRFATEEPLLDDGPQEEKGLEEESAASLFSSAHFFSKVEPLLCRIPAREVDLITMYYIQHKRQADIAEIFGVTQAAISYRLDRGLKRIRFLLSIPHVEEEDLRRDLPLVPFKQIDVDILVGMWETTCQSAVAKRLHLTQGRVRHRFFGAVKVLEKRAKEDSLFVPYQKIFSKISQRGFNLLNEVKLPQWADRGKDVTG